ncbi:MAG: hypothetical protein JWQ84_879 [Mucilaginibacter sp.]|nr:hypothetical protein [Mucilaginibacter sp.]
MELSIENFIFLKIMGMNQILFGWMSDSLNNLFHPEGAWLTLPVIF